MRSVLVLHVAAGSLAVVAGYAALFAPKGSVVHRRAGMLFVYAMIVMGVGAMLVGLALGRSSWMGGPLVIYLVVTAMLAVRRNHTPSRPMYEAFLAMALAMGVASADFGVRGVVNPEGPLGRAPAVASLVNALVLLLCAAGDLRVLRSGPATGTRRLAKHLWRMCFALFVATGSFFLGQAKVIPEPLRVWPVLYALAFLPLAAMFYWLWRVRRRPRRGVGERGAPAAARYRVANDALEATR